jgi:hypothetical protein
MKNQEIIEAVLVTGLIAIPILEEADVIIIKMHFDL